MKTVNYTKNQLVQVVRFLDQKDFSVYEGTRLSLLGSLANGGIPCELSMDSVLALRGMETIFVLWAKSPEKYRIKDAPAWMELAGKRWLSETHGLEFDRLPEGDKVFPYTRAWLGEPAMYLDEDNRVVYRGTNLDWLAAGMSVDTWRLTSEQIICDNGDSVVIRRRCVSSTDESYRASVVTDEMHREAEGPCLLPMALGGELDALP